MIHLLFGSLETVWLVISWLTACTNEWLCRALLGAPFHPILVLPFQQSLLPTLKAEMPKSQFPSPLQIEHVHVTQSWLRGPEKEGWWEDSGKSFPSLIKRCIRRNASLLFWMLSCLHVMPRAATMKRDEANTSGMAEQKVGMMAS